MVGAEVATRHQVSASTEVCDMSATRASQLRTWRMDVTRLMLLQTSVHAMRKHQDGSKKNKKKGHLLGLNWICREKERNSTLDTAVTSLVLLPTSFLWYMWQRWLSGYT